MSEQTINKPEAIDIPDEAEATVTKSTSSLLSSLRLPDTYSASGVPPYR